MDTGRRLSAIMFSDICGYSRMMGENEEATLRLLDEHNALIKPIIAANRGVILKYIGDAILSSYESASDAVYCAISTQRALDARNEGKPEADRIRIRIGIHIGDVVLKDGDVFGDGVNIAARVEPLAEAGGICISQTVYDLVRARPDIQTVCLGTRSLKNIADPMQIYKVLVREGDAAPPAPAAAAGPSRRAIAVTALAVVLALGLGGLLGWRWWVGHRAQLGAALAAQNTQWAGVPAGTFTMGCVAGDTLCDPVELPAHAVDISRGFEIMARETTVEEYRAFAASTGAALPEQPAWSGPAHPVVNVNWDDACAYCAWLGGRLPTEAEWEYAARGGAQGQVFPWGGDMSHEHANYGADRCCEGFSEGRDQWFNTSPGGSFAPNGYGIFDMSGNVWEWCSDWWDPNYYVSSPGKDPAGPASGDLRVLRGGAWGFDGANMRTSKRDNGIPGNRNVFLGFRCVRDVPAKSAP